MVVLTDVSRSSKQSGQQDSRRRILDAASELMAEAGYSGTSISMICRRSGLPPSSTYWHFGSKEGLLSAVVEDGARRWLEGLPRWGTIEGSPEERLRAMFSAIADSTVADATPTRLLLLLALERADTLDEDSRAVMRTVRQSAASGFRLVFREVFGTGTPEAEVLCNELAVFALAVADGAAIACLLDPTTDVHRIFDFLGTAYLKIGDRPLDEAAEPAER
jgi:AcrR family transcriptional regulator